MNKVEIKLPKRYGKEERREMARKMDNYYLFFKFSDDRVILSIPKKADVKYIFNLGRVIQNIMSEIQ